MSTLTLNTRRQELVTDDRGYRDWQTIDETISIPGQKAALILCDVWDTHHCRGAVERMLPMLPRMNEVVRSVRGAGGLIVHAPSNTMEFYEGAPARKRVLEMQPIDPPQNRDLPDPPLPVDSEEACDTQDTRDSPLVSAACGYQN